MRNVIRVAAFNASQLTADDFERGVAALREQVRGDFAAAWSIEADLLLWGRDTVGAGLVWSVVVLDHPIWRAQPPLADLNIFTAAGLPKLFVAVGDVPAGQDWTHRVSHHLLEMLVNPVVSGLVYRQVEDDCTESTFSLYAHEICDPCAAYEDGYECHGRWVSDFVFPAWFDDGRARHGHGGHVDERRLIRAPFQVRPNGWAHVLDLREPGWKVIDEHGKGIDGVVPSSRLFDLQQSVTGLVTHRGDGVLYPP